MNALSSFIINEQSKPFELGFSDCVGTADRWLQIACGVSPLDSSGLNYSTADEVAGYHAKRGGFLIAMNVAMRRARLIRTENPVEGDVGIIIFAGEVWVAICTGEGWFTRNKNGVALLDNGLVGIIKVWSAKWRQE